MRGVTISGAPKIPKGAQRSARDAMAQVRRRAAGATRLGRVNLVELASGSVGVFRYAHNLHSPASGPGGSGSFVTQDDADLIAVMPSDVKKQHRAANAALELDLEPPTRAAGSL